MDVISIAAMILQSWTVKSIILATTCFVVFVQWRMYKNSRLLTDFPNCPVLPIVGSLHLLSGDMPERMKNFQNLIKRLAEPTVFWFSFTPTIFLTKSDDILQTLNRDQDRETFGIFEGVLEDGILLSKGEQWRYIRRILNQAFTVPMLKHYLRVFNEQAIVMANCLGETANTGTVVDLWQYTINANFCMINENMLGYKTTVKRNEKDEIIDAALQIIELESKRFTNPILYFNIPYKIYLYLFGYGRLYENVHELPKKILEEKFHKLKKQTENGVSVEEKPVKTLIDFLMKINAEQPAFDEHRIRIEILNMIMTGSDTTATSIAFLCLFLAMYPEIQDRVYEEIQEVFKDGSANVQLEHCNQLKYTEQCIKETLRRFTLVPITFRQCAAPIKLSDQQVIPANCKVAFVYEAVHQNPSVYPEPEKYDPDRFSPENYSKNAKHFMGFGVGHRSCIGMKYAMISMKTQLVHLLRKYKFTTDMRMSDIVHVSDMVSRSKNGYLVKIWHRKNNHEI